MIKFCVPSTSAVFEPRTAATATTEFAGFLDRAAFGAHGTGSRRRGCWRVYVDIGQRHTQKNAFTVTEQRCNLHAVSLQLTFASLQALKPPVISVSVAVTPAVLKPSATRSATTHSSGSVERTTLWARHRSSDR